MPVTRSNAEAPLEPPLSTHRRIQSASGVDERVSTRDPPRLNTPPPLQQERNSFPAQTSPTRFPTVNTKTPRFPFQPPTVNNDTSPNRFPTVNNLASPPRFPTVNNGPNIFPFQSPTGNTPQSIRSVNPFDFLAAMREQQAFIQHQQTLYQQEREYSRTALREQHDFMAEQQRQLMSILVKRPPQSEEPRNNTVNTQFGPKVRMADPPFFDGSIKDTENFLSSLSNIFASQPSTFPNPESKIRYTLTFLTGGASNWRKLLLRDINDGFFDLSSWDAFETRFRETFGNPHLVDEARRKLWTIRQHSHTSEDFFLEFEEIRLEANICENSVVMFLQAALRPSILNEVLRRDPPPVSYSDWKSASLRADQNQRNSAATRSFQSSSSLPQKHSNFQPFRQRFLASSIPSSTSGTANSSTSTPTPDKIKPRPQHNHSVHKTSDSKNKNCWLCGKDGHFSRNCPDKSSNSKVRALLEHCEDLDAAYEAASTGADYIRNLVESNSEEVDDDECRLVLERFVNAHPVFVEHDE
jgi:hypothetical protein